MYQALLIQIQICSSDGTLEINAFSPNSGVTKPLRLPTRSNFENVSYGFVFNSHGLNCVKCFHVIMYYMAGDYIHVGRLYFQGAPNVFAVQP